MHMMHKTTRGFTLIELLVVIAIISVLSTVALSALNSARARAQDTRRAADLNQIRRGLELYATANNTRYPDTSGSWRSQCSSWGSYAASQVAPGLVPTHMPSFPSDPEMNASANTCCYLYRSDGTDYKLIVANTCSTVNYQSQKSILDPVRDGGVSTSLVESGYTASAWAVYTPGAAGW